MIDRLNSALEGKYRVERELGEGGMARVYLAEDVRHGRRVAVKVLRPALTEAVGAERFLNEIQVTAKLQHPNILPLFDSGEAGGLLYYVMPYVEGESLRDRLERERELPVEEAVEITREVARGLDYAHRQGVIHRDIKPGNVLLHDDRPVIADFGIALAVHRASSERVTETGVYVGTPEYMSPEQVSGERTVDARSDVYSLAVVLYEMLAGVPPFDAPSTQAVVTKVLTDPPPPLADRRGTAPIHVVSAVERALSKLPADRFRTASEFADALTPIQQTRVSAGAGLHDAKTTAGRGWAPATAGWGSFLLVGVLALILGFAAGMWTSPGDAASEAVSRSVIELPDGWVAAPEDLAAVALSQDGRQLVFVADDGTGNRLFYRSLAEKQARPLPGTERARGPFFSPDGDWVGFFADGQLRKVSLGGGPPVALADAVLARGAAWGAGGDILFTSAPGTGLWRVSASGGDQEVFTRLDLGQEERTHRLPAFFDAGDRAYFTIRRANHPTFAQADLAVLELATGEHEVVLEGGTQPRPLPTGHLVFGRGTTLQAVPLGSDGRPAGEPLTVEDGIMYDPSTGATQFAVADNGTLVYLEGGAWAAKRVVRLQGEDGETRTVIADPGPYRSPRFDPTGRRIAIVVEGANDDIWIHDLDGGTPRRLTFAPGANVAPLWSPDGRSVVFASNREGRYNLYRKDATAGSAGAERVTRSDRMQFPTSWHPSGDRIALTEHGGGSGSDVTIISTGSGESESFAGEPHNELGAVFSPAGDRVAYVSDESGRSEIYLQPYPATGEKEQVSSGGGLHPRWSRDGRTLYYRQGDRILAVTIASGPALSFSAPMTVVQGDFDPGIINAVAPYDVAPDGRGLLLASSDRSQPPRRIHIVVNWFTELMHRVPLEK